MFPPFAQHFVGRGQLEQVDALQAPAMGRRHHLQLFGRLRESDIEHPFSAADALQQVSQRQGGLARTRCAFQEIDAVGRQSAAQDRVQARASGGNPRRILWFPRGHMAPGLPAHDWLEFASSALSELNDIKPPQRLMYRGRKMANT